MRTSSVEKTVTLFRSLGVEVMVKACCRRQETAGKSPSVDREFGARYERGCVSRVNLWVLVAFPVPSALSVSAYDLLPRSQSEEATDRPIFLLGFVTYASFLDRRHPQYRSVWIIETLAAHHASPLRLQRSIPGTHRRSSAGV